MKAVKDKLVSIWKLTIDEDDIIYTTFYQSVVCKRTVERIYYYKKQCAKQVIIT